MTTLKSRQVENFHKYLNGRLKGAGKEEDKNEYPSPRAWFCRASPDLLASECGRVNATPGFQHRKHDRCKSVLIGKKAPDVLLEGPSPFGLERADRRYRGSGWKARWRFALRDREMLIAGQAGPRLRTIRGAMKSAAAKTGARAPQRGKATNASRCATRLAASNNPIAAMQVLARNAVRSTASVPPRLGRSKPCRVACSAAEQKNGITAISAAVVFPGSDDAVRLKNTRCLIAPTNASINARPARP